MLGVAVEKLIALALEEDYGRGDVTSESIFDEGARARGTLVAKEPLVLAGLDVAEAVFARVDPLTVFERGKSDGDAAATGDVIARVGGSARSVLAAERTALNFLQRLSGIATLTRQFAERVQGTRARVCDTRKTAPGFRALDKHAVQAGGGANHRADLASGILIKDNHIAAAGGVRQAVERAKAKAPHPLKIEVEVTMLDQIDAAIEAGAEIVLLDNMSVELVKRAVVQIAGRARIEVSGGVKLENVRAYAECGVDLISVGALTHSARAVDLSLEIEIADS